ncbi:MAG: hypothetical protein HQL68_08270 [Magnetococcales bacterium]|nr:hypothetical protein [Magnetococcales bacterium]
MVKHIDVNMIRNMAIAFGVAIAVTTALIMGSAYFAEIQDKSAKNQARRVVQMRQKQNVAAEDVKQIGVYFPQFQLLRQRGVIGVTDRVKWVETLSEEANNLNFSSLKYAISPAVEFKLKFQFDQGDAQVMATAMTLSMDMLHEEDLVDLLERLEGRNQGLYIVNECQITRTNQNIKRNSASPNMSGGCTLKWFNVKSRQGLWDADPAEGS